MSTNGIAAARTLLSRDSVEPGLCLHYVWQAYKAHGASTGRSASTALLGWERSDGKHHGDWHPPAGAAVWFGAKPGSSAGDVVISLGDGRVACTDYPGWGQVGACTITERQRQIGRPYLGWTDHIFDCPIDAGPRPAPQEEDDMFTDDDRALLKYGSNDRRPVAILWVGNDAWVCDIGNGTRYNVARGQESVEMAFAQIRFLANLGVPEYRDQAPFTIAGLTDITGDGTIREEVAAGIRDAYSAT